LRAEIRSVDSTGDSPSPGFRESCRIDDTQYLHPPRPGKAWPRLVPKRRTARQEKGRYLAHFSLDDHPGPGRLGQSFGDGRDWLLALEPATQQASSSGYGWILSCSAAVLNGEDWACWTAGLRTLFLPGSAS
jgi:hypothetical protein